MLNFFYDSLDTLKKVRKPTNSEVTNLTLIIFVVVVIAALMFALMDGIFGEVYTMIYESLRWWIGWAADVLPAAVADIPVIEVNPSDVAVEPTVEPVEAAVEAAVE